MQVPLCKRQPSSVVAAFGQPQEGNRTKPSFSWLRCPFQQKAGLPKAHPCKMLGAGQRTHVQSCLESGRWSPGPRALIWSCSPQPGWPPSGAMSGSQGENPHWSAPLALYGAQQGGDTTSSGAESSELAHLAQSFTTAFRRWHLPALQPTASRHVEW